MTLEHLAAMRRPAELHHVGIVVASIEDAMRMYRDVLGMRASPARLMPEQAVRVVMLSRDGARVELLQPLDASSGVARFLAERGRSTLHHVCFAVDDLALVLRELADAGVELIDHEPRRGVEGRVAFLHPRAGDGVLIELLDRASASPQ